LFGEYGALDHFEGSLHTPSTGWSQCAATVWPVATDGLE
jgi:hypothetical protein